MIRVIRGKRFPNTKINAAQASHPRRIACGRLAALSPHHAVRRLSKPRSRRNARFWARSPSRESADKVRVPWRLAVIAQADGSILPVGRIFEEAATPGCPQNAPFGVLPGTFRETLRQFTLENHRKRQLCCNLTALSRHRTSALAVLCLNHKTSATEISCRVVHKLWRTSILCGKRRKRRKKCLTGEFLRASLDVSVKLWLS